MKPCTASDRPRVFSISKRFLLGVLGCLGLLAQCSQAATCNYSIAIPQNWSMIANQCDNPSGNTLNNVFPAVPAGSKIIKWNNQVQAWGPISIFSGGIWSPNQTLDPGEGAFFFNPGAPFSLNVSGNPHTPLLPLVLPPNGCCIVSRQEPLTGGFTDIIGLPPQDGDAVWQYQSPQGIYLQDVYFEVLGGWDGDSGGNEPMASVGESVWICRGGNPSQPPECDPIVITQQPTNTSVTISTNMTNCVTFSVVATGTAPLGYQWCSNGVPIAGATSSSYTLCPVTLAHNGILFNVKITNSCSSVTSQVASVTMGFCSFTQGFYGNSKGKFNGTPSLTLIGNLLAQGPLVVGKTNSRSLTIQPGNAALLQSRLPAAGTPSALPNNGDQILPTAVLPLNGNGRFANVLLGQTITLSLNVRLDPKLLNFALPPTFCTQGVLPGPDGLRGTADDVMSGSVLMFSIPNSVLSALANVGLGITNTTLKGLLELANRALAGQPTGGASLAEINAAVDAINRGFDECRVLVDCSNVIEDSFNNNFTNSPPLGGGGGGFAANLASGDPTGGQPANIRVRVPNLDATKEPGEPDHAGNPGGKSLWWRWLASGSGPVLLQTAGSSFDSLLAVYTGSELSNLTLVASNDDPPGGGALAEVNFEAQAGTEYHIAVDGFDGGSGTVVLSLITERPRLCLPLVRAGDEVQLCVQGETGRTYTVEASADLADWTPIASLVNADGTLRVTDPALTGAPQRFYRLSMEF
jgi:hypothetical protein